MLPRIGDETMPFIVPIDEAKRKFPEFEFIDALTPSAHKAAFHVKDSSGNEYCLKIISPDFGLDRLDREISALHRLSHDNIAKLIEYTNSTKDGEHRHFMIEEFIAGTDLTSYISGAPLDSELVRNLFISIADGLIAVHGNNIVHRDIKPGNIRVTNESVPVIIDFGLARHLDLPDLTLTEHGARIGTLKYFAPEQVIGTKYDIDHRTDLFAVGVIIYEALIGYHPFDAGGLNRDELMEAIVTSENHFHTQEFLDLPDKWQMLIKRLLKKKRVHRLGSSDQLKRILQSI